MTSEWKEHLLSLLEAEVESAKEYVSKTDEALKFTVTGWSQSGDKYHAQVAAQMTRDYLGRIEKLKSEVENAKIRSLDKVEPVSFVEIKYDDGSSLSFTFVTNGVSLTRTLFISKDSALGKAIFGRKVGESFYYELVGGENTRKFSGKIVRID